jgi:cellulose synthase (UDP-forming)
LNKINSKASLSVRFPFLAKKLNPEKPLVQGSGVSFRYAKGTNQMRVLVLIGVVLLVQFFWWFADSDHVGYAPLFWLLTFSLCYKMLRMLHEWYHYVDVLEPIAPERKTTAPLWTVDMLTTACPGEPYGMIIRTLEALVAVRYPHTTYLCDEGDDPFLRAECARLGVRHVTRVEKKNAKAGNINNALHQATGELCVVLDPDHEVTPDFLDQVLPYFEDPAVGYVQVVQAYGNQKESLVALGAAEQTYHFYGPLMMGMNGYNTVQAIGANCTFRRAAIDSIGGHAAGLTEDMHTAMRMHAAGWKSIYAPVVVSRGLVPSTLGAFYSQQLKWSRGTFDLLVHVYPKLFKQFTWRQRLHYLTVPLYFFSGVVALIDITVPIASLLLLEFPWHLSLPKFALHMLPVTVTGLLIRYHAQQWLREPHEQGLHLAGGFLRIATWWVYSLGFVYTLLNVKVPYIPTPKEGKLKNEWLLSMPNLLLAFLSIGAAVFGMMVQGVRGPYTKLMATLALINALILLLSVLMAQHALLNKVRSFMWSTPVLHAIKKWVDNTIEAGSAIINKSLRSGSIAFATGLALLHILVSVGLVLVQWHEQAAISDNYIWTHTGSGSLRIGAPHGSKLAVTGTYGSLITWAKSTTTASQVVELKLQANAVPKVPVALIEKVNKEGNIPLLTWSVNGTPKENYIFQQQVGLLLEHKNHLMLRPILKATTPKGYREAWQSLVKSYRIAGDTSAVWVWTPPKPDSIATYFPGSIYVTWVASKCEMAPSSSSLWADCYYSFRRQTAIQIEMQSKPTLLYVPQLQSSEPYHWAQQVAERYPEIKAIMFMPSSLPASSGH